MRVYFSGISGTGIGPLAELAQDAGCAVSGSDLQRGAIADELAARNIAVHYGDQDGVFLREQAEKGLDWFVYSSALPEDHTELQLARAMGLRVSKRDEFLAELLQQKQLKLLAVAGTHGKTTTVAMLIWTMRQLGVPVSYAVGTTLSWGAGAQYMEGSQYFVYEADEYDRNFLAFHPEVAIITSVDYDHPDIYPTPADYLAAFAQFESQSASVVKNTTIVDGLELTGDLRRYDASLAFAAIRQIFPERDPAEILAALNKFPGAGRRFEEITTGVYSDYAHHPQEIRATVEMANELKRRGHFSGLAVIYQPHQNIRQHEIFEEYFDVFDGVDQLFWLPTYLVREDPSLEVLTPSFFIEHLKKPDVAQAAEADDNLAAKLKELRSQGWLIVLMTAGPADGWLRETFAD